MMDHHHGGRAGSCDDDGPSNVAASGILVSALSCTGPAHGVHPLFVLAPVAMASSYAFLLPIGDRYT